MRAKQRGMTLGGVLIVGILLAFALLVAFRTVPAVTEYMAVERIVKQLAEEGRGGASVADLRKSFDRRGQIDDISTITGSDLRISKQGGDVLVEAQYSRTVPLAGNVSLLLDFHASSAEQ